MDREAADAERFEYFTECAPLGLGVLVSGPETVGLTEDRVRTMAESRLRAARLYAPELPGAFAVLSLLVFVSGPLAVFGMAAYTALIAKRRFDPITEGTSATATVDVGLLPRVLAHTSDANGADSIMKSPTERADALVADYLRVNEGY